MVKKNSFKDTALFRLLMKIYDAMFGAFIFVITKLKQAFQYLF